MSGMELKKVFILYGEKGLKILEWYWKLSQNWNQKIASDDPWILNTFWYVTIAGIISETILDNPNTYIKYISRYFYLKNY